MTNDEFDGRTYLGTLRGYRYWRYQEFSLGPHRTDTVWLSGVKPHRIDTVWLSGIGVGRTFKWSTRSTASCWVYKALPSDPHTVSPDPTCQCGFYGWYSPKVAHENRRNPDIGARFGGQVFGAVEVYGKVILGEVGFRAEKARILGVIAPSLASRLLLKEAYPDIVVATRRRKLLEMFPPEKRPL